MAGKASEIDGMWRELRKHLALDPPTDLHGGTYLGQIQKDVQIEAGMIEEQAKLWADLFRDELIIEHDPSQGNKTAADQRRETELPEGDPGFILDPNAGIMIDNVKGLEKPYNPRVKSDPKAKAKAKASPKAAAAGRLTGLASEARAELSWESASLKGERGEEGRLARDEHQVVPTHRGPRGGPRGRVVPVPAVGRILL